MKTIYKIALSIFSTTCCIVSTFGQQTYINREWENATGTVGYIHKTSSILDNFQNLIVETASKFESESYQIIFTTSMISEELKNSSYLVGNYYKSDDKTLKHV